VYSSPALGANGTIYIANEFGFVYGFERGGALRWKDDSILPGTDGSIWSSFAIAEDGTLYIGRTAGVLLAIGSDSLGLSAVAPWPKYRGANGNTGRSD
jgi:outer membrane protein assembly factor BamB